MNLTRKVAANTAAQVIGRLVGTALSLISVGVLTRYLGPAAYGNYSIAFLYATIATTLADFGIYSIGLREMSANPEKATGIANLTITLKTITQTALFMVVILVSLVLPYPPEVKAAVSLALLGGLIATFISSIGLYFQFKLKLYLSVIIELVVKLASVGLILWLVSKHASLLVLVGANPVSMVLGLIVGLILLWSQKYALRWGYNKADAIKLLRQSLPLGIVTILGYLHFRIDTIILSLLKSPYDVGIYSVAYKVIEIVIVLPAFFTGAIFPILSLYHAQKDPRFAGAVQRSFDFLCLLGLPMAFGIIATAKPIILFIAGPSYMSAILPLQILMLAVFFGFINNLLGNLAIVLNLQSKVVRITLSMLITNIVLNLFLISQFSYRGAAVTTVITEFLNVSLMLLLVRKHIAAKISFGRLLKTFFACIVMFGLASALVALKVNLVLIIVLSAVVYSGLILLFKGISIQEVLEIVRPERA